MTDPIDQAASAFAAARGKLKLASSPANEALQRQLTNDEPKCANCRYWEMFGADNGWGSCGYIAQRTKELMPGYEVFDGPKPTTDLSVCSKWERITNAKAEAEQAQ